MWNLINFIIKSIELCREFYFLFSTETLFFGVISLSENKFELVKFPKSTFSLFSDEWGFLMTLDLLILLLFFLISYNLLCFRFLK